MYGDLLLEWLGAKLDSRDEPLFIGLDGRSGAGKSTLAEAVRVELGDGAAVVKGDDFYSGGSFDFWDTQTDEQIVAKGMDWTRQLEVLSALRSNGVATWHPFDWDAEDWDSDDARLAVETCETQAAPLVILEGAYSCRPELHSVLDALVLLAPPREVSRAQLLKREGEPYRAEWESRFSGAEDLYFGEVMPEDRFDLVLGDLSAG